MRALLHVGSIVHYVPSHHDKIRPGEHVAAVVVRVWDVQTGLVNLRLFLDGDNQAPRPWAEEEWKTSVPFDPEGKAPFSWHFPEQDG